VGKNADIAINIITKGVSRAKNSLNGLNEKVKGLSGFAKTAAVAVGVALAQAIRGAVKGFMDFDDAMTQSLAIMQTTVQQQEQMKRAARDVATEFRVSNKDAAESFFFLASAGLDAEQSVAALPQVTKFAQAGMFDMATATDLATDAQSALGLTVKDAQQNLENLTRVTDVLVKANQLANASVQQFSEALTTKSGAALKVVNKDIEEGVAVLAAFADRGVKGAEAGDKLNQVLRDIPRATAKNGEEFKKLGLEMFDAEGNMKNVADIIENLDEVLKPMSDELKASTLDQLGLNRGVADAVKILSGAGDQIREYEKALRSSGGATEEVAENQMDSLRAQTEIMGSKFSELGLIIMDKVAPALEGTVGLINTLLDGLIDTSEEVEASAILYDELAKKYGITTTAVHSQNDALNDQLIAEKEARDETKRLVDMYAEYTDGILFAEAVQRDMQNNLHELDRETANYTKTVEDSTEVVNENAEAEEKAAKAKRDIALPTLNRVIDAMENLNDIYEEQEDLLAKQEKASEKVAKSQNREKALTSQRDFALQKLIEAQEQSKKVTIEEELAIIKANQRLQEAKDNLDGTRQKQIEYEIAQKKVNEAIEKSTSATREEIEAKNDYQRALDDLERQQQKTEELQRALTEAQKEYNDATAETPLNLMKIANAKKELDDALQKQLELGTFNEALNQMVDMGLGSFMELRQGYFDMIFAMKNGVAPSTSSTTSSSSGDKFDTEGNIVPENEFPAPPVSDFDVRNRTHVPQGNKTTINLNMQGIALTQMEVTESVAEVIRRARNEGLDVG